MSLALTGAMIIILLSMGRLPFCNCGEIVPWVGDIASTHTSQHIFDPYSFSHLQHGLVFYWLFKFANKNPRLEWALLLEAAWEILENTPFIIERYRSMTSSLNYFGDSVLNSFGDLLSCGIGFYLCTKLPAKAALSLFVIIEVSMISILRDSLLLNVIMLVYPLDFIKNWQMVR